MLFSPALPLSRPALITVTIYDGLNIWNLPLFVWSFQGVFTINIPAILAAVVLHTNERPRHGRQRLGPRPCRYAVEGRPPEGLRGFELVGVSPGGRILSVGAQRVEIGQGPAATEHQMVGDIAEPLNVTSTRSPAAVDAAAVATSSL
ncbi:hypothetical protein ACFXKY_40295 [Streptomyces canus]|uniref:hypothetical protein n=1 Tax=Streptomyces canus TaxID=58343 RepID=UPI00369AC942